MTPTQLIYEAWKRSRPIMQHTKDAKGDKITRKIEFVDPLQSKEMEKHKGRCFLCGQPMEQGMKLKKVLTIKFTDWNQAQFPAGTHLCPACCFTILTNKQHRYGIRTFSNVANEKGLFLPDRKEMRGFLVNPPEPPFVINLAVSQKKHIAFKGQVNYSRDVFQVMYEEMSVMVNRKQFKKLLDLIEHFLYGFTKTEISTGKYNQKRILDFGIEAWEAFEEKVRKYRGNPLLDVVMFVAQKIEEEEEVKCYMDSALGIKTWRQPRSSFTQSIEAETGNGDRPASTCGDKSNGSQSRQPKEPQQLELF